ncbi:MAG: CarD family transcriptional regulator [Bacilli bacterium]|nr:CarD family transcriptional regulator [Bacilli bacterium]
MYKVNDYLMYGKDVCQVKGIELKKYNDKDYYLLIPLNDDTLKLEVPVDDPQNKIKKLIKKEELNKLINKIPDIETVDVEEKFLESEYKKLLATGDEEDLIKVIKTTYLRNKKRTENNKRKAEVDSVYLKEAEESLLTQISAILDMSLDDAKNYFTKKIEELAN